MSGPWSSRPREVAHLLNPAFVAAVAARVVDGYSRERSAALPCALAFLAAPIVLHRGTRDKLPRNVTTRLAAWLPANPGARVGFADRMRMLVPFVREGLIFGMALDAFAMTTTGELALSDGVDVARELPRFGSHGENACLKRGTFVGKWLAHAGSVATIFALWGVRP